MDRVQAKLGRSAFCAPSLSVTASLAVPEIRSFKPPSVLETFVKVTALESTWILAAEEKLDTLSPSMAPEAPSPIRKMA